ncbi:MAG TPA: hypothetical protein VMV45_12215 [Casimicrobiaceae bacterium]|nr:hypothetical protein [Casimicrobiaceae bacterium]
MLTDLSSSFGGKVGQRHDSGGDRTDFSIILGGPFFQLLRRAHVSGDALELARRRMVVISMIAWAPLLLLSVASGSAIGGDLAVPFLKDIQAHARFLLALPLLIIAELVVHQRIRPIANEFVVRDLVTPGTIVRFENAVRAAMRLRNSRLAEVAMVLLVYGAGIPILWSQFAVLDVPTWYAEPTAQGPRLTLTGFWYAYVSVPIFQFLLLRWYFRLLVWSRFLWHVSRIPLNVSAMHADRMAGLGFLSNTVFAFVPLLMAHGVVVSGTIANRILYQGSTLADAKVEIAVVVALLLLLVLGPLAVFAPQIARAKRAALRAYGRLAQRYVVDFEHTWLPGGSPAAGTPLGSGDIQSLADLSNSLETVRNTRSIPITRQMIVALGVATLAPIAPLLLTVIPLEELAKRLLKLLV